MSENTSLFAHTKDDALSSLKSIQDWIRFGISQAYAYELFYGHGSDNPSDEMVALILRTLDLPIDSQRHLLSCHLTRAEKEKVFENLRLRIDCHIPVSYILKEAFYCGLYFTIDKRVLIPRSPIAELIEEEFSPWIEAEKIKNICDLCTGSGCIGLAAAMHLPYVEHATLIDLSQDALEVAKINVEHYEMQEEVTLIRSDIWDNVPPSNQFDLILSNPPYVPTHNMQNLPEEYIHEPEFALDGGLDGLVLVEKILAKAHEYLSENGILIVEVGEAQPYLEEKYPQVPFTWLQFQQGGDGVFLLTAKEIEEHHELWAQSSKNNEF